VIPGLDDGWNSITDPGTHINAETGTVGTHTNVHIPSRNTLRGKRGNNGTK